MTPNFVVTGNVLMAMRHYVGLVMPKTANFVEEKCRDIGCNDRYIGVKTFL